MPLPVFKSEDDRLYAAKHEAEVELAKRELERSSFDTVRVYNPLPIMFSFQRNGYWHRIAARSQKDFPRYLARHYFKKIADKMIGDQQSKKGEELKALREQQMGQQFLDHYEENIQVWDKVPKMNDPELLEQIRKVVIVGLVEEYGMEEPPMDELPNSGNVDIQFRSVHQKVFDDYDMPKLGATPVVDNTTLADDPRTQAMLDELHAKPLPEKKAKPTKSDLEKEATV